MPSWWWWLHLGVRSNLRITDSKCDCIHRKRRLCHEWFIISTLKTDYPYLNPCGNQLLWISWKTGCHLDVFFKYLLFRCLAHHWLGLGVLVYWYCRNLGVPEAVLSHPSLSGERSQRSFPSRSLGWNFPVWDVLIYHTGFGGFYSPENLHVPWKPMVGRCIPYWNSPCFGDMLVFGGVPLPKLGFVADTFST